MGLFKTYLYPYEIGLMEIRFGFQAARLGVPPLSLEFVVVVVLCLFRYISWRPKTKNHFFCNLQPGCLFSFQIATIKKSKQRN